MIRGVEVTLLNEQGEPAKYTLPPLSLDVLEDLGPRIDAFMEATKTQQSPSLGEMKLIVDVVHGALQRNYPQMPRMQVARSIDMGNMMSLFMAALNVSMPPVPQEIAGSGEGASLGESIGAGSKQN